MRSQRVVFVVIVGVATIIFNFFVRPPDVRTILPGQSSSTYSQHVHDDDSNLTSTSPEATTSSVVRPPLSSLIEGETIIGDVDFLLDFAIVGHAKTATTNLNNWLRQQPSVHMYREEIHALTMHQPANMVQILYNLPPSGLHGYKAPRDIADPITMDLLAEYFPSTKLIVGLRHPISWFQSLYNFMDFFYSQQLPPAENLIGECLRDMTPSERPIERQKRGGNDWGVCTDLARFHVHLSLLGKTNVSDPRQDELLGPRRSTLAKHAPIRNKVFIYDSAQLSDLNSTRFELFKRDIGSFLSLKVPLGPPPQRNESSKRTNPLDICLPQYAKLRVELLRHGIAASTWILDYFMDLPDVFVSSPDYFQELLQSWHTDPCTQG